MKKITTLVVALFLAFSFTSCQDESLQGYLVKSQEKTGFITFDVPASILQVKSDAVSESTKATLKTLKKINVVALPKNSDNSTEVAAEKAALDKILNGDQYKSLMRFTHKGIKINLLYSGNDDEIDEVIAYGYSPKMGVGLARILGDNMNPSDIMKMMDEVKLDGSGVNLEQFNALFSEK